MSLSRFVYIVPYSSRVLTCRSFCRGLEVRSATVGDGKKRRFSIFTRAEQKKINAARKMTTLPDLSKLLGSRLGGSSSNKPIVVSSEATREETLTASLRSAVVPDPVFFELPEGSLAP